jgi:endoglucanase
MKSLIQKLTEVTGPSGYETQIRDVVRSEVESLVDDVSVDNLGNLIARKGGEGGARIMLAAHIDEIGLIVTFVDERGFARFQPLGGVRPQTCLGGRVRFLNGSLGVIGGERVDPGKLLTFEQLYIDLGASSRAECPVRVGDVAAFERSFRPGHRLAKVDDHFGVAVDRNLRQMQALKIQPANELYFVFSVQEEVGVRGATTAAYAIDPDLGLAVDVTASGDTPKGLKMEVALGKGPAIKVRDSGMLSDPRVVDWMVKTAERARLPYQLEILEGGSTDARAIQLTRAGVPAGCLSIPCRYVHHPSEMVDFDDVQKAVSLMVELLSKPVQLG